MHAMAVWNRSSGLKIGQNIEKRNVRDGKLSFLPLSDFFNGEGTGTYFSSPEGSTVLVLVYGYGWIP
jgi:hypothetical protein